MPNILKDKPIKLDLVSAIANIKRKGIPKRVFYFEHGLEHGIKEALCACQAFVGPPKNGLNSIIYPLRH